MKVNCIKLQLIHEQSTVIHVLRNNNNFPTMIKQSIILLFLLLSIFGAISTILPRYSGKNLTGTEKMLIYILQECNLKLNNTIFHTGNNPDLTQALLTTQPSVDLESWSLISHTMDDRFSNLIAKSGIVVVFNSLNEYKNIRHILHYWKCMEDCKVIFLSKMFNSCKFGVDILMYLGYSYFDISYYICNHKNFGPIVYTRDKYHSTRQRYWNRLTLDFDSMYEGGFYRRPYDKDLCLNFNFERRKLSKNPYIYIGAVKKVRNQADMRENFIFDGDINRLPPDLIDFSIPILEKLLKIKFFAYIKSYLLKKGTMKLDAIPFFWSATYVDVMGVSHSLNPDYKIAYSHPVYYDTFVILSHKQAEATPLQKIAKFYGIWTLISLIMLLIITFIVIYLKTNRKASLAAFDVLRLLINSGVEIPISTLSLKIFFCIIFLYFMVIHSTFSGNLPRFLTIPEFHNSVDSLEDLSNPWITTIYDKGFYTEHYEFEDKRIEKKIEYLADHTDLFEHFMMEKNSVCIVNKVHADLFMYKLRKSMNGIYMSKNDVGKVKYAIVVRPRFYLREKIQWATAYMFDIGGNHQLTSIIGQAQRGITKQYITTQVEFRKISINDLKFAFIFLAIGNTVGLVCFLIELVVGNKYYRRISFNFLKKSLTFRKKKTRIKIRRIVVKPKSDIAETN